MVDPRSALVGTFIDAVAEDLGKAVALLAAHPDLLNARWIHNETVLHFLAVESFVEGVRFLAARGADLNTVNEFGDSPLIEVTVLGFEDIAEVLLEFGANPNVSSPTRDNPLDCAVRAGNVRLVALLLKAGADPHYRTLLGETVVDALDESPADREAILTILAPYGIC